MSGAQFPRVIEFELNDTCSHVSKLDILDAVSIKAGSPIFYRAIASDSSWILTDTNKNVVSDIRLAGAYCFWRNGTEYTETIPLIVGVRDTRKWERVVQIPRALTLHCAAGTSLSMDDVSKALVKECIRTGFTMSEDEDFEWSEGTVIVDVVGLVVREIKYPGNYAVFDPDETVGFTHNSPLVVTVLPKVPDTETKTDHKPVKRWHAHMQIEYCKAGQSKHADIESLEGVDPRIAENRKFIHDCLDEYLNVLCQRLTAIETTPEDVAHAKTESGYVWEENGFHVMPFIDN